MNKKAFHIGLVASLAFAELVFAHPKFDCEKDLGYFLRHVGEMKLYRVQSKTFTLKDKVPENYLKCLMEGISEETKRNYEFVPVVVDGKTKYELRKVEHKHRT